MTVWVVRGGENLKYLPWFESEDVVGIGWSELPRSLIGMSRQELAGVLRATYPDAAHDLEAYRFRRQLYYATCAILVSIPSSYSEGVRYPSPF